MSVFPIRQKSICGLEHQAICDFENHSIQIDEYLSDIKLRYAESDSASPPPSVHYVIYK